MWLTAAPTPPPLISLSLAGRNAGEQLRAVNKPSRTSLREQLFGPAQDLSLCLDSIRFDSTPRNGRVCKLRVGNRVPGEVLSSFSVLARTSAA